MSKSRVPKAIRKQLFEPFKRLIHGPVSEHGNATDFAICLVGSQYNNSPEQREAYRAGYQAANESWRVWLNTWIIPQLRQFMSWTDGEHTAHEISEFGLGYDHEPK